MRILTFLLILLVPFFGYSQKIQLPTKEGKIFYEVIDSVKNTSKDVLYNRAKLWFTKTFNSAKDVVQSDDKEGGIIAGKGIFTIISSGIEWPVSATYEVTAKEGKYRIRVYDFYQLYDTSPKLPLEFNYDRYQKGQLKKMLPPFFDKTNAKVLELIKGLQKELSTSDDF